MRRPVLEIKLIMTLIIAMSLDLICIEYSIVNNFIIYSLLHTILFLKNCLNQYTF